MLTAFPSRPRRRSQRGTTLLESMLAFVALASSALAVGHLQSQLRLDGDIARERSEAVRLGEAELENLRSWSVTAVASGASSYAAIADADHVVDHASGYASHTAYAIARRIDAAAFAELKTAAIDVGWTDRSGARST